LKKRKKKQKLDPKQLKLTLFFPKPNSNPIEIKDPSKLDVLAEKIANLIFEKLKPYLLSPSFEVKQITLQKTTLKKISHSRPAIPKPEYLQELKNNPLFRKRRELVDNI